MKQTLGIYGFGGLGREVLDIAKRMRVYDSIVIIDDFNKHLLPDIKCYTFEEFITFYSSSNSEIIIAQGEPKNRIAIKNKVLEHNFELAILIDPSAIISKNANIKAGAIICGFSIVAYGAEVGENCLINVGGIIGHDVKINSDSVVSSKVNIGGNSIVGKGSYLGMNSVVKENIKIGDNSILSMASVLYKNLDDNLIAVGNPARPSRKNENNLIFKKNGNH